jgi:hypothetical protein
MRRASTSTGTDNLRVEGELTAGVARDTVAFLRPADEKLKEPVRGGALPRRASRTGSLLVQKSFLVVEF